MSIKEEFLKFNIDVFGICDAAPYNEAMGTDYGVCIVALFPYYNGYSDGSNISIYTHGRDYHLVTKDILTRVADSIGLRDYRIHSDIGPDIERTLCVNAGLAFRGKRKGKRLRLRFRGAVLGAIGQKRSTLYLAPYR